MELFPRSARRARTGPDVHAGGGPARVTGRRRRVRTVAEPASEGRPRRSASTLLLDREAYRVVGVMPSGFRFPARRALQRRRRQELWVPVGFTATCGRRSAAPSTTTDGGPVAAGSHGGGGGGGGGHPRPRIEALPAAMLAFMRAHLAIPVTSPALTMSAGRALRLRAAGGGDPGAAPWPARTWRTLPARARGAPASRELAVRAALGARPLAAGAAAPRREPARPGRGRAGVALSEACAGPRSCWPRSSCR